jgi:hypothetical protein
MVPSSAHLDTINPNVYQVEIYIFYLYERVVKDVDQTWNVFS